MMKLVFLCLLPLALGAPSERFALPDFLGSLFDMQALRCDVQLILDLLGGEPSEQACEGECHALITEGHVVNYGCPLICRGIQTLAHQWHLIPETTDPNPAVCSSGTATASAA